MDVPEPLVEPQYLGEIVSNAWSTVGGKGYVKNGEQVTVERDSDAPQTTKFQSGSGKKQMSLKAMFKPQNVKPAKRKADNIIVRLVTMPWHRRYPNVSSAFARLPQEHATWVSKLLDYDIVEMRGIVSDVPEHLTTGTDILVTLRVYILPLAEAFWSEGMETSQEIMLRHRKDSIVKLFKVLSLKPVAGAELDGGNLKKQLAETLRSRKPPAQSGTQMADAVEVADSSEEEEDGEELEKSEIDKIYAKAQTHDISMPEMMEPAAHRPLQTFALTLRNYQRQALQWLTSLELGLDDARDSTSMHPLWSKYHFPSAPDDNGVMDLTEDDKPFYFNPYSGELSLKFPRAERNCRGGILADVGMGKTIMLSALIQTNRTPDPSPSHLSSTRRQLKLNSAFRSDKTARKIAPSTLVVAPTSLLNQWAEELERSAKGGMDVIVWHGQGRLDLESELELDDENDTTIKVVVTSYGVLVSEHSSKTKKSPIFDIQWFRVVLDEAHNIKSRTSKAAKAVYNLKAQRRWAVTGTPIVNRLEDLYSLLKFLDFRPWSEFSFFRSFITIPFLAADRKALEVVQVILEQILLRREKNTLDADGNKIVQLPPKEIVVEKLVFSPAERTFYDAIFATAKNNFDELSRKGLVGKNYTNILAMLMKLRRAVLHPHLIKVKEGSVATDADGDIQMEDFIAKFEEEGNGEFAKEVLSNLDEDENEECALCLDVMDQPVLLPLCSHKFCKSCIIQVLETADMQASKRQCPKCSKGPVHETDLIEVVKRSGDSQSLSQPAAPVITLRRNNFQSSTKLDALLQHLRRLRTTDPTFRAVVFSQFTSFLDLIDQALDRDSFEHLRFDGTMDLKKKTAAINAFRAESKAPKILVISLKAGGVGLNLTTANYVFMMDCWWNSAIENQAIDRIHRLGQTKPVFVRQFIIENTIEGRILKIQKRKTAIVKEAFRGSSTSKADNADPDSVENLKIMFGEGL
ncbi:SNF2 family N-terminal domain-containing protein [Flagelloscypha sp. PMI_526]|nr:SNF2 family N-terminal domain-containing protein [Flagelloscypha sp. PMI_526]